MPAILRRPEFWIFCVALLIRLAADTVLGPANYDFGDAFAYRNVAHNIAAGKGFQITPRDEISPRIEAMQSYVREWHLVAKKGKPTMFYEPILPLVLAGLYKLFGSAGDRFFIWLQIVLGCCTCVLVYKLGRRLAPRGAVMAGFLAAVYPLLVFYSIVLMTESLFFFFLVAAILQGSRYVEKPTPRRAALLGLWLALGTLTRSTLMIALPFVLIGLLLGKQKLRERLAHILVWAAVLAAFFGAWTARNYRISGHAVLMPSKGAWNFYNAMASSIDLIGIKSPGQRDHWNDPGFWTLEHLQQLYPDLKRADLTFPPEPLPETEYERARLISARTREFLLSNPGFALQRYLWLAGKMYLPFRMDTPSLALQLLMGLAYVAVILLGVSGWWMCRKQGIIQILTLALLSYGLIVPLYSLFSSHRGRMTFDVIFLCLSACSLGYIYDRLRPAIRPAQGSAGMGPA